MSARPPAGSIVLEQLWHRYGARGQGDWCLQDLNLRLEPGELLGLLGPSGCGKTTLLRLIAGFEQPSRGRVLLDGREVAGPHHWLAPERRGVGMVFQDYALFPHLTAWQNACFGLARGHRSAGTSGQDPVQQRRWGQALGHRRVRWLFSLLGLDGLEQRFPHALSGGQRQRLALVRALAPEPRVLLLDEPFSNLDVEVRLRLRRDLPALLKQCNTSAILVTHDPQEALAVCDRIAVVSAGRLEQCASPQHLVEQPASPFCGPLCAPGQCYSSPPAGGCVAVSLGTPGFLRLGGALFPAQRFRGCPGAGSPRGCP
jgi:iron(III) transport system ATP-binding protein